MGNYVKWINNLSIPWLQIHELIGSLGPPYSEPVVSTCRGLEGNTSFK